MRIPRILLELGRKSPSQSRRRKWPVAYLSSRFQEELVSKRALFFFRDQIYFRCRTTTYAEHFTDPPRQGWPSVGPALPVFDKKLLLRGRSPIADLSTVLAHYTGRVLSNPGDVFRAIEGTLRRFSELLQCTFFQGMPTAMFDLFLLFNADLNTGVSLTRRPEFPSYSWLGWKGKLAEAAETLATDYWFNESCWIVWYKRLPSGHTTLVWEQDPESLLSEIEGEKIPRYRLPRPRFIPALPLSVNTSLTTPSFISAAEIPHLPYPLLQFWTISVFHKMEIKEGVYPAGSIKYLRNPYRDEAEAVGGIYPLDAFGESTFYDDVTEPFEFILLSESANDTSPMRWYQVMLIEWNGRIAMRRGTGAIESEFVFSRSNPAPVWKEILLG